MFEETLLTRFNDFFPMSSAGLRPGCIQAAIVHLAACDDHGCVFCEGARIPATGGPAKHLALADPGGASTNVLN